MGIGNVSVRRTYMQLPYRQVTDDQIRRADSICAVDPKNGMRRQLYGQNGVAHIVPYPAGPYMVEVLEVEMPSTDDQGLSNLERRVRAVKNAQKDTSAEKLANVHYQVESGLRHVIRFTKPDDAEYEAGEPLKLLEVNENTVPSGVVPLGFDAIREVGIDVPSIIVEVTPSEYDKIRSKELPLPKGWESLEQRPLAKPTSTEVK